MTINGRDEHSSHGEEISTPKQRTESFSRTFDTLFNCAFPALAAVVLVMMAALSMDASYLLWAVFAAVWALIGWWFTVVVPRRARNTDVV
jgi:hypothetical protein